MLLKLFNTTPTVCHSARVGGRLPPRAVDTQPPTIERGERRWRLHSFRATSTDSRFTIAAPRRCYRARRTSDGACVVIKRSQGQSVSARQLTRYRNEYELLRLLDCPGVVKAYDLLRQRAARSRSSSRICPACRCAAGSNRRPTRRSANGSRWRFRLRRDRGRRARGQHHSQGRQQPQRRLRSRDAAGAR